MRTLSVSACRRPLYTHLALSALAQCRGVERYEVLVNIDATGSMKEELARVVRPFTEHHGWTVSLSDPPLGCNGAILSCVDWGFFHGSQFHVHLEDDTLPHRDFLVFMEWADLTAWNRRDIFSVCGYSRLDGAEAHAHSQKWFSPWGWGIWKDRWDEVRPLLDVASPTSWDCQMNHLRGDRSEIIPSLGLVQNIGQYDGTYNNPDFWLREQFVPAWAGTRGRMRLQTGWHYQGETPK